MAGQFSIQSGETLDAPLPSGFLSLYDLSHSVRKGNEKLHVTAGRSILPPVMRPLPLTGVDGSCGLISATSNAGLLV